MDQNQKDIFKAAAILLQKESEEYHQKIDHLWRWPRWKRYFFKEYHKFLLESADMFHQQRWDQIMEIAQQSAIQNL